MGTTQEYHKIAAIQTPAPHPTNCRGPVKGPEERHELGITWNKYIERKYKYSIGKSVLNVSLTAKVLGWS